MRIECPSCAATYQIPDGLLAVGQTVSCARCGQAWMPIAPVGGAAPVAAAPDIAYPPAPAPPPAPPAPAPIVPPAAADLPVAPAAAAPPAPPPAIVVPPDVDAPQPATMRDDASPRAVRSAVPPLTAEPSAEDWPELALPAATQPIPPPRTRPAAEAPSRPEPVSIVDAATPGWTSPGRTPPRVTSPGWAAETPLAAVRDDGRQDWFDGGERGWAPLPERSALVPLAWIVNLMLLAALCGTAVAERDWLMQSWPPSSRLFAALGLDDR